MGIACPMDSIRRTTCTSQRGKVWSRRSDISYLAEFSLSLSLFLFLFLPFWQDCAGKECCADPCHDFSCFLPANIKLALSGHCGMDFFWSHFWPMYKSILGAVWTPTSFLDMFRSNDFVIYLIEQGMMCKNARFSVQTRSSVSLGT